MNLKEGYFNLAPEHTKTGEPRYVYFNGPVRSILERLGKVRHIAHKYVFTYHGKPVKSIKIALANALEEAGIKDFRFHDLRHTFVSNARKAGVDRTVIMKLTGHKTLSMFTRYNTVDQADAKDAMEKLDSLYSKEEQPSAAIVLQAQKKGENTPQPLNFIGSPS